jgi:hypothetical protein
MVPYHFNQSTKITLGSICGRGYLVTGKMLTLVPEVSQIFSYEIMLLKIMTVLGIQNGIVCNSYRYRTNSSVDFQAPRHN